MRLRRWLLRIILLVMCATGVRAEEMTVLTEEWKPLNYKNSQGQAAGMVVDVVREIQRRIGDTSKIAFYPWVRAYGMAQKQPNVVLFTMERLKERNDLFYWVGPVQQHDLRLYLKADSSVRIPSLEAAKQVSIAVYRDDFADVFLTAQGFTRLERTINAAAALKMLVAGHVVATANVEQTLQAELQHAGLRPVDVSPSIKLVTTQSYIAISKHTPALTVQKWQNAFAQMQKDGSFAAIFKKTFPGQKPPTHAITAY